MVTLYNATFRQKMSRAYYSSVYILISNIVKNVLLNFGDAQISGMKKVKIFVSCCQTK